MIGILVGLGVALGLALVAVVYLAAVLPRRVVRLVLAEHARADTRALVAKVALHTASSTEVALIVEPLRALLEEQTRRTLAAREHATATAGEVDRITHGLHALVEWLAAFASAQHAQAIAAQAVAATQTSAETTRRPNRAPPSRPRPPPHAPAIMPPGSATLLPPEPAQLAAGLTRPSARPLSATRTPTSSAEARPRSTTMIGLAAPSGPRRAQPSSPTLLSMQAVAPPTTGPAPPVAIQSEVGEPHEGGAA